MWSRTVADRLLGRLLGLARRGERPAREAYAAVRLAALCLAALCLAAEFDGRPRATLSGIAVTATVLERRPSADEPPAEGILLATS